MPDPIHDHGNPKSILDEDLIVVPCEDIPDWWIVERAEHDGREWEEYSDDQTSATTHSSARIVDGDIEGTGHEMRTVAQAIERGGSAAFKRCQATWTEPGYLMSRPRGGSPPVLVTHDVARGLAADIRRKIRHAKPSEARRDPDHDLPDHRQAVARSAKVPRSCSVVDSIDCECPPNGLIGDPSPVTCYACGNDVCRSCSTLITYRRRRCRVCFDCQDTRKIGRAAPVPEPRAL